MVSVRAEKKKTKLSLYHRSYSYVYYPQFTLSDINPKLLCQLKNIRDSSNLSATDFNVSENLKQTVTPACPWRYSCDL